MRNSDAGLETALQTRLSSDLQDLRRRSAGKAMTVGELEQALKGRGFAILVLLMALPSCLIPLPGLSTPFGIAICLMGIRIGAGQRPWLPKFIRQKTISPARLTRLLDAGVGFASKIERIVKPPDAFSAPLAGHDELDRRVDRVQRLDPFTALADPAVERRSCVGGVVPGHCMMERDGLLVLIGHVLSLASWALLLMWWFLGVRVFEKLFG